MTDSGRREDLYDTYLDRLLAGVEVDPATFLQRENCTDAELLEKLTALHLAARLVPSGTGAEEPVESGLPFERMGDYRLLRCLGRGGMGEVYLAEQESLGRQVALKILQGSAFQTATASLRFHREARSLARLRHPNVVTVFDFGVENGQHYLVMEYIPGQDLTETIAAASAKQKLLPHSTAVQWAAQIARALESAHEIGIFHRDVKASNIRITPEGRAVLVDFGLASETGADGPTLTHAFLGSPAYASPEQVRGNAPLEAPSDIYSLGATLYRCITGQMPFEAAELEQLFHKILTEQPRPPRELCPGLPRDLDLVIRHAMEKDPEHRYRSAAAFADDLEALLDFRPIRAQPPALLRRSMFWVRSHRASAAATLTATVAILSAIALFSVLASQRAQGRMDRAQELLEQAQIRFDEFGTIREEILADALRVQSFELAMESSYLNLAQLQELDGIQDAVQEAELQRERLFNGVLDLLDQAETVNPEIGGTNALRAKLYMARHLESELAGDAVGSRFYLAQALRFHDNPNLQALQPTGHLHLTVSPPGPVQVQAFAFLEQSQLLEGGDHRMVPVARDSGVEGVTPGTWCLRLRADSAPLRQGDLIVTVNQWPVQGTVMVMSGNEKIQVGDRLISVDGLPIQGAFEIEQLLQGFHADGHRGDPVAALRLFQFQSQNADYAIEASSLQVLGIQLGLPQDYLQRFATEVQVVQEGVLHTLTIPAGIQTRVTTIPLLAAQDSWRSIENAETPFEFLPGAGLLRVRREGFEDQIVSLRFEGEDDLHATITLVPSNTTPSGFRRVTQQPFWNGEEFWIQEHEVTSAEYLQFLNSAQGQAQISASAEPILFPRTFRNAASGGLWMRDDNGMFSLSQERPGDWPVMAISWYDANQYAAWRTAQARAAGLPYRFRLPTVREFRVAAGGAPNWSFPYGPRFRPNWSNCCFSRPVPAPEPVLRYPRDESVFGVFDTSGSALEWLDTWWNQAKTERYAGGGSWAQGGSIAAKPMSGLGIRPEETSLETSFRLVLEIDGY